ncbi:hypothetical protein GQ53DRAFT_887412 [Thozetella sp. PMI_491]|nr:hypothetical protein GQ53DRAFT_887412 [Thozetella sp. PMI_491]
MVGLAGGSVSPALASTNDQVNAGIDYGSFLTPAAVVRPRFRYWLPDSSVDPDTVREDIKSNAELGAGGIEFLPYFGYGGTIKGEPPGADWALSNFGTPQFLSVFQAALEAHKDNGLKMDFAMGPNQGQGVPASADDEGLQWDLVSFTKLVPGNSTFDGVIPGWGTGELVALIRAEVLSTQNLWYETTSQFTTVNVTYDQYILKDKSLVEYTSSVDLDTGHAFISAGTTEGTSSRIFAFYQRLSLHKNLDFAATDDSSIFDNGSYIVDHYSARGAETITKFWETYILSDSIKSLLSDVGNYGWEDSVEMTSNISWSRGLPERFQRLMGYEIRPILPLLAFGQNNINIQSSSPGAFQCILNTDDQGAGYINDFRAVLQDGYREYLTFLTNWTNTVLGVQFSAQPSYNLPMDMLATIPDVNAPECESLGFLDNIDIYRQFTGAANLAGKRVISNELGAMILEAFRYTIPDLLFSANRGFAGGVNQYVIHGQAFSGSYYATTWPGYVPWGYLFSESWNNKEPVWNHGLGDAIGYLARAQQILQTGVPKTDIAVFWKQSATSVTQEYDWSDLINAEGWSYSYISPDNFALPHAFVNESVLAPNGPGWKALLIHSSQNLSITAVEKLIEFANAGLPLLMVDGSPGFYSTKDGGLRSEFEAKLGALGAQKNVHSVSSVGLLAALSTLGLTPHVAAHTNGTIYTVWRETLEGSIGYAFIYSDLVASSGEIVFETTKTPYWFDPWTGERRPVLIYTQDGSKTTIPITLAGNQSAILAFSNTLSDEIGTPSFHITAAPSNVIGYQFRNCSGVAVHVAASEEPGVLSTSSGKQITLGSTDVPTSFALGNWTLTAEHWEAPANLSEQTVIAVKRNSTHNLIQLESWLDIPALANASGIGYYSTTFNWPPPRWNGTSRLGAYLTIPHLINTARLFVNGRTTPPVDLANAMLDISPYLVLGTNEVLVEVPTVMWNYLRSIFTELENAGAPPLLASLAGTLAPLPGSVNVGLVGDITVSPFKKVRIIG